MAYTSNPIPQPDTMPTKYRYNWPRILGAAWLSLVGLAILTSCGMAAGWKIFVSVLLIALTLLALGAVDTHKDEPWRRKVPK